MKLRPLHSLSAGIGVLICTFLPLADAAENVSPEASPASSSEAQLLGAAELEALVAPIALYPDALLAEVLIASTYPLEIVQAERWLSENQKLTGDKLKAALDQQPWDDSVKALVANSPRPRDDEHKTRLGAEAG